MQPETSSTTSQVIIGTLLTGVLISYLVEDGWFVWIPLGVGLLYAWGIARQFHLR